MTPIPAAPVPRLPLWFGVWTLLFTFFVFYQARHTYLLFVAERGPYTGIDTNYRNPRTVTVAPEGSELRVGDVIEKVNGLQFRGWAQFDRARFLARPGDRVLLEITRGGVPQRVSLTWRANARPPRTLVAWVVDGFTNIVMPWFAVLFGFWLLFLRPHDGIAWLFLWVMLCATRLFQPVGSGWEDYLRQAVTFANVFLSHTPGAAFLLLGLYLGHAWPARWLRYTALAIAWLIAVHGVLQAVSAVWEREAFRPSAWLAAVLRALEWMPWLTFVAFGLFFYLLFAKYYAAESADLKRRFRILLVTMHLSLQPALIFLLTSKFVYGGDQSKVPSLLRFVTFVLLSLAPLSLAYVILVHRAVDVGVVVRSGLRYALARGGVFLLQLVVAAAGIVWAVEYMEQHHHLGSGVHAAILAAYAGLLFAIRWLSGPLFRWIDRSFFRDAYSSEQVMAELTENVRTMMNPQDLFATLSSRLGDALHVRETAFFLRRESMFEPAYATGGLAVNGFAEDSAPVQRLRAEQAPVQVFLDDQTCWCNKASMPAADRERLLSLNTQVLLPLNVADRLVGFVSLGPKKSESPYTRNDLRLLQAVGTQAGMAIENARLAERLAVEAASKERVHRELEIASEVQQRLLPQKTLTADGVTIAGTCRPALAVGGDYFDYFRLESGLFGIAVGDVAGKGLGAALVMATLQASLRTQVLDQDPDLAGLVARLNHVVYDASTRNRFATLFYAQYDAASRTLVYVNAGHNPPFVLRAAGGLERLRITGIAVGLRRKQAFRQEAIQLAPGDVLVAFTDGISEAMNVDREEWGEERLAEFLATHPRREPEVLMPAILAGADAFAAGATQHDDMTLVLLRCT